MKRRRFATALLPLLFAVAALSDGRSLPTTLADDVFLNLEIRSEPIVESSSPSTGDPASLASIFGSSEVVIAGDDDFSASNFVNEDANDENEEVEERPACDERLAPNRSAIFCGRGAPLLDVIQEARLFPDSKTFVDRPLKGGRTSEKVLAEFARLFPDRSLIVRADLERFVEDNFEEEGSEMEECLLVDWKPHPPLLDEISDRRLQKFAARIVMIWRSLCRRIRKEIFLEPHRFSLLYVPYAMVVPGGRFRETYYWDSFWTIKGLLASGMTETARGMLLNLAWLIREYGHVPNGNRAYYLGRSQPPLLASMLHAYTTETQDLVMASKFLPILEIELEFWDRRRSTNLKLKDGSTVKVYRYRADSNVPRPESYREDVSAAGQRSSLSARRRLLRNIASTAESGWDFSSRWLGDKSDALSIDTTNIAPVDLNAYLCQAAGIVAHLYERTGNETRAKVWREKYDQRRRTFERVFWSEQFGNWLDLNLTTGLPTSSDFYLSSAAVLSSGCYDPLTSDRRIDRALSTWLKSGALNGTLRAVPTSMIASSEQWDWPNAWAPLQHQLIDGLRRSGSARHQKVARDLAARWLATNLAAFERDGGAMWEKYDVRGARRGDGGEYEVQAGFGWTNGVVLDLLREYGAELRLPSDQAHASEVEEAIPAQAQALRSSSSHVPSSVLVLSLVALMLSRVFAASQFW